MRRVDKQHAVALMQFCTTSCRFNTTYHNAPLRLHTTCHRTNAIFHNTPSHLLKTCNRTNTTLHTRCRANAALHVPQSSRMSCPEMTIRSYSCNRFSLMTVRIANCIQWSIRLSNYRKYAKTINLKPTLTYFFL